MNDCCLEMKTRVVSVILIEKWVWYKIKDPTSFCYKFSFIELELLVVLLVVIILNYLTTDFQIKNMS